LNFSVSQKPQLFMCPPSFECTVCVSLGGQKSSWALKKPIVLSLSSLTILPKMENRYKVIQNGFADICRREMGFTHPRCFARRLSASEVSILGPLLLYFPIVVWLKRMLLLGLLFSNEKTMMFTIWCFFLRFNSTVIRLYEEHCNSSWIKPIGVHDNSMP
jgi:hypothetical protein